MIIRLRCPAGHRWDYEGLRGDFSQSVIDMQTDCPRCGQFAHFTITNGVVGGGEVIEAETARRRRWFR